jgi:streptogramin lyase
MITTEANSRTTPQRRSSSRPARGTRRTAPAIEGLEARSLLSISIAEFPIPTQHAGPDAIVAGPDGNLWFAEGTLGVDQFARINLTTHVVTEFPEPPGVGAFNSMVAGPDGYLYALSDGLYRIDPATGAVTSFPAPPNSQDPGSMTVGPDGNLWFVETDNKIGEFNLTTHAITEYPIPTADSVSVTITAGPDGNLWFTEAGASQIGRLDPATGAIVEFPTPTPKSDPWTIAAGPDGNLWFTEFAANQVAAINPATGAITEYPIPVQADGLLGSTGGITAGPDGDIWFTEAQYINHAMVDQIEEIDVQTHAITQYSVPSGSAVGQISQGPDGNLWFADAGNDMIGQVSGIPATSKSGPTGNPNDPTGTPAGPTSTPIGTHTRLAVAPDPSTPGSPVVLTATVATDNGSAMPGGEVVFTIDGAARPPVPLTMVGGVEQASLAVPGLSAGSHTVVATYVGGGDFTTSEATGTAMVVTPPRVVSVRRAPPGPRRGLVLGFSDALDAGRARDVQDYRIVGRDGRPMVVKSAVYNPAARTVTLRLRGRIRDVHTYRVTVVGAGPAGVADAAGIPLAGGGLPGSDYTTTLIHGKPIRTGR